MAAISAATVRPRPRTGRSRSGARDETRTGRPGAATLDRVDDRKLADADQERRARLNERLRQAFLQGAEEDSRRRLGRGLTREE